MYFWSGLLAIYHFSAQVLGRRPKVQKDGSVRPGSSAVAAAAYRSGERLQAAGRGEGDERVQPRVHDYSKRSGVSHSEVMAPPGSAPWLESREVLWNTVEAMEVRKDAQLAREFNMALPYELSHDQRVDLVRGFVEQQFVRLGMVADIALHDPDPDKGMSEKNFHAHVMLTLRKATRDGLHPVKTREWNSPDMLKAWRAAWSLSCNEALERAGKRTRVDHRTLEAQRTEAQQRGDHIAAAALNRAPEVHQGPKARQAERRGFEVRSGRREVGPGWHRERQPDGTRKVVPGRRVVDTRRYDRGTRLSWFDNMLAGNNQKLREDLVKIDRQHARMQRKFLHWTRQVEFWAEGRILGAEFRFNRWKAAEEAKARKAEAARKRAHALKRKQQAEAFVRMLADILSGGRTAREKAQARQRDVKRFLAPERGRGVDRTRGRRRE